MPGEPDPRFIIARRTLLDALEALEVQRRAVIVVGAQAIYLHTGEADVALAPYTTDGDLLLDVDALIDEPTLGEVMERASFHRGQQPGCWISGDGVVIDLHVPDPDHSVAEQRFVLLGMSDRRRLLVVVHAERPPHTRLISARRAAPKERRAYEEER